MLVCHHGHKPLDKFSSGAVDDYFCVRVGIVAQPLDYRLDRYLKRLPPLVTVVVHDHYLPFSSYRMHIYQC